MFESKAKFASKVELTREYVSILKGIYTHLIVNKNRRAIPFIRDNATIGH